MNRMFLHQTGQPSSRPLQASPFIKSASLAGQSCAADVGFNIAASDVHLGVG